MHRIGSEDSGREIRPITVFVGVPAKTHLLPPECPLWTPKTKAAANQSCFLNCWRYHDCAAELTPQPIRCCPLPSCYPTPGVTPALPTCRALLLMASCRFPMRRVGVRWTVALRTFAQNAVSECGWRLVARLTSCGCMRYCSLRPLRVLAVSLPPGVFLSLACHVVCARWLARTSVSVAFL